MSEGERAAANVILNKTIESRSQVRCSSLNRKIRFMLLEQPPNRQ